MSGLLKVKLIHSPITEIQRQKDTLRGLGLRRIHQVRFLKNTPPIRGMIQKVIHLVTFEEVSAKAAVPAKKKQKVESYRLVKK